MNFTRANTIHVTIDRLVLEGLEAGDRQALVAGLERELSRLFSGPQPFAATLTSRRTPVLRLGHITWQPGRTGAEQLGGTIARAIGTAGVQPGAPRTPRGPRA